MDRNAGRAAAADAEDAHYPAHCLQPDRWAGLARLQGRGEAREEDRALLLRHDHGRHPAGAGHGVRRQARREAPSFGKVRQLLQRVPGPAPGNL